MKPQIHKSSLIKYADNADKFFYRNFKILYIKYLIKYKIL